jgi:hypothetical protein
MTDGPGKRRVEWPQKQTQDAQTWENMAFTDESWFELGMKDIGPSGCNGANGSRVIEKT